VGRHSQNGPSFTKAPPKRGRSSDQARPVRPDPQIAEDEDKRLAAKSRRGHRLWNTDIGGFLREFVLKKKN
jgi:hypothetical protein